VGEINKRQKDDGQKDGPPILIRVHPRHPRLLFNRGLRGFALFLRGGFRYNPGVPRASEERLGVALQTSAALVSVLFLAAVLQWLLPFPFRAFGIVPRTVWGLAGIVFAPLLHANQAHLMANAIPLFVLLTLLFWDRHYHPVRTLAMIWVASGLGTWLIGRAGAVHLGASSLVYGLVAYLIVAGLLGRSWRSAFVALLVLLAYGGIIYGLVPQRGPISWEGHLSGAVAGCWAARKNQQ
jgi:membrane associated rhomboid family serine protease